MTLEEANRTIADDAANFQDWVLATGVISSSTEANLENLIACLKRKGLPAEMAATALYVRTNRPRPDSIESLIVDADDWIGYLKEKK